MNTKHTPHTQGPWTYDQEDNLILDARGRVIGQPRSLGVGLEQRNANGKLTSAAPEVTEASAELVGLLDAELLPNDAGGYEIGKHDADKVIAAIEKLRAAISKVPGARHVHDQ